MKKQVILLALFSFLALAAAACQVDSLPFDSTPVDIPTRLILPTRTALPPSPTASPVQPAPAADQHSLPSATTAPTPAPSPAKTYVGKYSQLARGIELNESTGNVDPSRLRADFGIVYAGYGSEDARNYATHIMALYQANLPCLLLWDILSPPGLNASNPDKTFPPENEDPNVAAIARAANRKTVAGVIIRFVNKKEPNGKTFTQVWMANYIAWAVEAVYHQTGKPLFVMTSQAFIDGFGKAPQLNNVISKIDGMSSWKSATAGQSPQLASWDDFPVPADDYVPEYISDNPTLYFINYARTAWKFDGIDASSTPLWLYKAPAAQLKKDLGYLDHSAATQTPVVP